MSEIAVVTGGTRGIGRCISEKLVEEGFMVFATYRTNHKSATEVENRSGGKIKAVQIVGLDIDKIKELQSTVLREGTLTALINNAGITEDGLLINDGSNRIIEVMDNNFQGTVNFCLTFLESMIAQRVGNIVNISSSAATKAKPGNCAYGCSKIAIERFSKGLALEVARFNIHVNCLAPGFVETELFETFAKNQKNKIIKNIPTRKILSTDEVARVTLDLVSRRINTTGSILPLGNGEQIP